MTMTIDEMIGVMQASKEGKIIEFSERGEESWRITPAPAWNWSKYDFRVKPESKIRPYQSKEEFLKAQSEHGMYFGFNKRRGGDEWEMPNRVCNDGVRWATYNASFMPLVTWKELAYSYSWIDGTPCGIEEG